MRKLVCVSVPPEFQDPEQQYVEKLYRGVKRNTTAPFDFEVRSSNTLCGFWNKVYLFPPKERIVFLDLDTVIVGNVDFLFEYDGSFAILADWGHKGGYGSAVMSISPGFGAQIPGMIGSGATVMNTIPGDQELIRYCVDKADIWQELFPGQIVSYKLDGIADGLWHDNIRVVCFHGQPRPAQVAGRHDWMIEHWR